MYVCMCVWVYVCMCVCVYVGDISSFQAMCEPEPAGPERCTGHSRKSGGGEGGSHTLLHTYANTVIL